MKYLLIISHDDAFVPTRRLIADIRAWNDEMQRRGIRRDGQPLRPAGEATTVRVRGGRVVRKPGPFARSKEKMCAYELIECPSVDAAVDAAARHPMAKVATVEVRPVWSELAG